MQTEQYTILQIVHESSNSIIYRARNTLNGTSVILKAPAPKEPSTRDIARIIHQYELMKDVRLQGITNIFDMHHTDKSAFLVIEDFEGEALQESLLKKRFTIQEFLKIGITTADALAELHAAGVLHRDIKPHNILIQRESGQIKITDFGTAIPVQKHNQQRLTSNQRLDGTLAYMSPEQTDRINRAVDHRSDLYSLGVTLYQLLTGVRPFQSNEALELIHNHIARKPTNPQELDPSIPTVVADIVMKLLEKDPEDRYQGAKALKADLQLCLEQLTQNGKIEPFPLGRHGLGEAFHIPQKLYGREKELEVLLEAFGRASLEAPELMLISGYSGVGKSALVRESQQSIAQSYGYFSSGKFDQYKRDIPFNALLQAIEGLLGQILQEPEEQRSKLAARLKEHLGPSRASLLELFPQLGELIEAELAEEQPAAQSSQTPLPQLLEFLLTALARPEQPIVLFLDDLQWADLASLQFLQGFLKSQIKHMLLLGAYRDNEVTANHPLSLTIEAIASEEGRFHRLELPALLSKDVSHLISDVCQADESTLQPLVDTVYNKTMGNPFFINQFLTSLYQERLLFFESESQRWQWDIRQIEERYATANVIEFMTDKLKKLPATTQLALTYAACIGNRFEAQLLAKVRQQPLSETLKELEPAISEGLIMPLNTDFMLLKSYAQSMADDASSSELNSECRFLHDRIQHAAYSLMNDRAKSAIHIAIGQQLVKDLGLEEQNEQIFTIVNQINLGLPSIDQTDDLSRRQFAELNLKAGKQARGSAAYNSAMRYLEISHQLLPADAWESDFELSKEVYSQLIYCETMLHNLDSAEAYLNEMLNHFPEAHQRAIAYVELIDAYYSIHANQRAIDFGLKALASFGLHFPSDEAEQAALVVPSFERLREALNGRAIIDLKDLPDATDQTQMALMQMMLTLGTVSYALAPMLFQLLSVESILINIKYGHNNVSAYAYNCYGIMLLGAFNDRKSANEYVQLALALNEKFPDPTYSGRIKVSAFGMLSHWFMPLPDAAESLREAIDECLRTDDRLYTLFGIWYLIGLNFMLGRDLQSSLNDMYRYFDFIYHSQNSTIQDNAFMLRHTIFALQGKTSNTANLNNEQFNEERFLEQEQAPHVMYVYHSYNATMHFWLENYQDAYRHSLATNPYQPAMVGQAWPMEVMFMRGIASCQLYDQANPQERATYLRQAEADVNALRDVLADYPETYLAKERLLSAEIARIQGDFLKADECYVAALEAAQQQSYLHIVALSNELLAKFYATRKHQRLLTVYINDAYAAYLKWGANAKAQRVLEAYSDQIVIQDADDIYVSDHQGTHSTSKSDQVQAGELLDMGTVLKASQVIASEIDLPQLIQKLMAIMLEHAGAQRGVLLLQGEQELEVTAVYQIDPAQLRQNLGPLKLHSSELPISLITQVLERNAPLVIQDALKEEPYKNELYIKQQKSKSILVLPLLHQQRLTGILYLENKLTSYVFTVHKLELLRLLSSQAVIALENALLFAKAQQISEELRLANEQLQVELIERAQAEEIQRRLQEEVIHAQKTALAELSTPLIPLSDQILIMPLIGTIDSQRAEQVMSTLLHGTQTFHVQVVIIDITGVPVVDTGVASSLIQSAQAIRLLGAQTFISGIRPEVAQTLVGLGVELSGIQTHGSLQQSISYAAHYVQTLAHNQGIGKQKSNSLSGLIPSKKAQSNGNGNGQTQFNGNGQLHTNGHVNGNGHANGNGHGQDAVRQEEQFELLKFPRKQSKN